MSQSSVEPRVGQTYVKPDGERFEVLTIYWDRILKRHEDARFEVIDAISWDDLWPSSLKSSSAHDLRTTGTG